MKKTIFDIKKDILDLMATYKNSGVIEYDFLKELKGIIHFEMLDRGYLR